MMKRVMSLLLVLALLVPTLCACGDSGAGEKRPEKEPASNGENQSQKPSATGISVEIEENWGITDELVSALSSSLVMRLNSSYGYTGGIVSAINDNVFPFLIDDTLYLPAAFVAKSFGAETQWDPETQVLSAKWENHAMTICASDEYITVDGTKISMPTTSVIESKVLLTPAEPLCKGLGKTVEREDDLIIVGDGISELTGGISQEARTLLFSGMDAKLTTVNGWNVDSAKTKTYEEWVACTKSIVLDPTMAPWSSPKDQLAAVTGNLYVENISITPAANDTYDCSMDVYNYLGYTYGAVEVYGADDCLVEVERIKPFSGQKTSVVSAVCDVGILMSDITKAVKHWDLDYMNYKTPINSEIQTVKVNVPVDGYVIITANPQHSDRVAAYNMIHTLVEVMFAVDDVKMGGGKESAKSLIKDYLIEQLAGEATLIPELAAEFRIFLSDIAKVEGYNLKELTQTACDSLMNAINRVEFDFWGAVRDAVKDAGHSTADFLAEEFLTSVVPGADQAFCAWKISANVSNIVCLFMDLNVISNAKSLMLENFNWREAYAKILREFPKNNVNGTLNFTTGYVNGDMVPELIIIDAVAHFGNTMYMYTYCDRKIVPVQNTDGKVEFSIPYAAFSYVELQGIIARGNMHQGYESEWFDQLCGTRFQKVCSFSNDAGAVYGSSKPTYYYNDSKVGQWFYDWKLGSLKKEYNDCMVAVDGFSLPEVSESNIRSYFEN